MYPFLVPKATPVSGEFREGELWNSQGMEWSVCFKGKCCPSAPLSLLAS